MTTQIGGSDATPKLRRDAARNHERISLAAMEVFAERGLDVSMADVAERAGVGVGTVYRRFGDKPGLIADLFAAKIDQVLSYIDDAANAEDPVQAFIDHLVTLSNLITQNKGLRQVLLHTATQPSGAYLDTLRQLVPHSTALVQKMRDVGWLRPEFSESDLPLILHAVGATRDFSGPEYPDLWRRVLRLLIDGMRADSRVPVAIETPPPLPPPATADADVDATVPKWPSGS